MWFNFGSVECGTPVVCGGRTVVFVRRTLELEVTADVNSVVLELSPETTECCDVPPVTDSDTVVDIKVDRLTSWVPEGEVLTTESSACVGAIEDAALEAVGECRVLEIKRECWESWSVEKNGAAEDSSPEEMEKSVEGGTSSICVVTLSSTEVLAWNEDCRIVFVGMELDNEPLAIWRLTELSTTELITRCVEVSKSSEVSKSKEEFSAVVDFIDMEDDGATVDSTDGLDDTAEL